MNDTNTFRGLGVALPTPFAEDGTIDYAALATVTRHVASSADFLVALGSTGEAATVEEDEREAVIRCVMENALGRRVVVGTGHNATARAVHYAREAVRLGADGLLVVTPYYNKPQAAGLVRHYEAIARSVPGTPILVYNVPGRTGANLLPRDLSRLWEIPGIVGVKESSGNLAQIGEIARTLPAGKVLLSGDDALALPSIALGAEGLISVAGNAYPSLTRELVSHALEGRRQEAATAHARLLPFMDALFAESNPAPIKAALSLLGLCTPETRLPLVPASAATRELLSATMAPLNAAAGEGARR